jgi:hypothetical protein
MLELVAFSLIAVAIAFPMLLAEWVIPPRSTY